MISTTVGVKLDDETRERLKRLGAVRDRSVHWLMKEAIMRYLHREERYEVERIEDAERWQRYVDTGNAVQHEEVKLRLDELASKAAREAKAG